MRLSQQQLHMYAEQGFLFLPECFSADEIGLIKAELPTIFAEDSPRRVVEKNTNIVRSVYGTHETNAIMARLAHHPRLVEPTMQILASPVYVYQFKINAKAAFGGDRWEWHQDYIFWAKEDGMPTDRVLNAVIFLDEVNEFNGPLLLIPGSHREGMIDVTAHGGADQPANSPAWLSNLTADLKYSLDRATVARQVTRYGIQAPKGPFGSVLFFHGNIIHGSAPNMSPFDRALAIATYNSVENVLAAVERPRPSFLSSRSYRPIVPLHDDALALHAGAPA